ncbi:MAG: acyl-CoA thioesterase [Alphaproteobacteria bacterium]|jgi:acyl-CoA thioester hydrolase
MARSDFRFSWPTRVRYSEVDNQGIVYNAHYLTYFDTALTEYIVAVGLDYEGEVKATNHDYHAVRAVVEWQAPIGKREDIEVCVRPGRLGRTSMTFTFEVHPAGQEDLRTTGEVVWVYTNQETHQSAPLPQNLLDLIEAYEGGKP